ncbi:hypothetical protein [Amycolatopsis nigrescens]|uniref:hypothetical protein n=1 Tax=Amycolatopsis nigrescens TaxID=381445 RepID=UPI0012FA25D5|nr:hypothetical protein [Amycolatopsis nigrescens]
MRDSYNGALNDLGLAADPWTGNRYAFTGGNPITRVEIDGHKPCGSADDCQQYDQYLKDTGSVYSPTKGEMKKSSAMLANEAEYEGRQQWVGDHSPKTNDTGDLLKYWHLRGQEAATGEEFWNLKAGEQQGASDVCFGLTGCREAYVHLLENPGDVGGVKQIAATYCVDNFDECANTENVSSALTGAYNGLATAAAAGGILARLGKIVGGSGRAVAPAAEGAGEGLVRVGRWMSPAELVGGRFPLWRVLPGNGTRSWEGRQANLSPSAASGYALRNERHDRYNAVLGSRA